MPRPKPILKLPAGLIDEIGGQDTLLSGGRKRRGQPSSRKDIRKAERVQKKSLRNGPPPQKRPKLRHTEEVDKSPILRPPPRRKTSTDDRETPTPKPKSILKKTNSVFPDYSRHRSISPPVKVSRAVRDKLAEDDEEIAALEKKLGLKKQKGLPQSFKDDGLDELLEGLDEETLGGTQQQNKSKTDGDEWLERKRMEARKLAIGAGNAMDSDMPRGTTASEEDEDSDDDDGASDSSLDSAEFPDDESEERFNELDDGNETLDDDDDFDGFDSDGDDAGDTKFSRPSQRIRENPYVAPGGVAASEKYIPPSLRKPSSSDSEALVRLRRQTQGLVNRLTEANMISILGEMENLYRNSARQHVTSTLVDLLLTSVCEPTSLPDTLIILPAGFIAAIYKVIGTDFGAQVIQRTVELFHEHYERATVTSLQSSAAAASDISKETSNLIMLLSELYNFQVIGSNLIFDYIRLFLGGLSELNAELLLKIIRTSGPQLRQDDPSALKDIVASLRPAAATFDEKNISVRTKFMIETINDLKNNRMKTGGVASAITSEHTIRMKKTLGTLNSRSIKASEPLRIGLKDIQEADKKGKWWLVGASWAGKATEENNESPNGAATSSNTYPAVDAGTSDLVQLAREHRMNTDIRRAIFITVMSAADYQDAYLGLMKLKLKRVQELEIPKVLIHCSGAEKSYNPYYTLIAKKICGDRRLKMAFQFSLWDLYRLMGEKDEEDDVIEEDADSLDIRQIVNLAKMFGALIVEGGLGLNVLKKLNLGYLQAKTQTFLEVLLITVILQSQKKSEPKKDEQALLNFFTKVKDTPQLITGLHYFLKKVVSKTDIAGGKAEKSLVKWGCTVAGDALEALMAMDAAKE